MTPLEQLEAALGRYYAKHPEPRSMVDTPREPLVESPDLGDEPWPSDAEIERQRVEFEARAAWHGYGPRS